MVLVELHKGLLAGSPTVPGPVHGGWRLLTPCNVEAAEARLERYDVDRCPLFAETEKWESGDFSDLIHLFDVVFTKAAIPCPWERLMDKKQLHDVGTVRLPGSEPVKIWQFEKRRTAVRLLWAYAGGNRVMLVTHAFLKHQAKTPSREKERSARALSDFSVAVERREARLVSDQGGRPAFERMYGEFDSGKGKPFALC